HLRRQQGRGRVSLRAEPHHDSPLSLDADGDPGVFPLRIARELPFEVEREPRLGIDVDEPEWIRFLSLLWPEGDPSVLVIRRAGREGERLGGTREARAHQAPGGLLLLLARRGASGEDRDGERDDRPEHARLHWYRGASQRLEAKGTRPLAPGWRWRPGRREASPRRPGGPILRPPCPPRVARSRASC